MRDRRREGGDVEHEDAPGGRAPTEVRREAEHDAHPGTRPPNERLSRARRLQDRIGNGAAAALLSRRGRALPADTRTAMEAKFGHDFTDVRVHEDGMAESAGAEAVTLGSDIHFARGQFAPGSHDGKELLAHELAHVVQQEGATPASATPREEHGLEARAEEAGERVARGESVRGGFLGKLFSAFAQPRKKKPPKAKSGPKAKPPAKKKPKGVEVTLFADDKGALFDAAGAPAGVHDAVSKKSFVAVDDKGKPATLAQAKVGELFDGKAHDVWRTVEATVEPPPPPAATPATGAGTPADAGVPDAPASVPPGPVRIEQRATLGKSRAFVRDDGKKVLSDDGREPLAPKELAKNGITVGDGARVDLAGRGTWIWMPVGVSGSEGHWVQPKRTEDERRASEKSLADEAKKLPTSLAPDFTPALLKQIAATSVVEGGFESKSGRTDTAASVGILQWAQEKKTSTSGTLSRLFEKLKQRAADAEAKDPKDRDDADKLYIAAWKQVTAAGLDVRSSARGPLITIKEGKTRRDATGQEVETAIGSEMGKGSLRTYQLIAAKDWLDELKGSVVVPGPQGAFELGLDDKTYADLPGGSISINQGTKHQLVVSPPAKTITIGDRLKSDRSVAMALSIGVNRPNYLRFGVWRALLATSPKADFKRIMDALWKGLEKHKKQHDYSEADVKAAGLDATYAELQALLWPTGTMDEAKLELEMKRLALSKYPKAERPERERRLATVTAAGLTGPK